MNPGAPVPGPRDGGELEGKMDSGKGCVRKTTPMRSAVLEGLGRMRIPAPVKFGLYDEEPVEDAGGHGATHIYARVECQQTGL